ncbi:MAG: ATP-binding protein [Caulobacterales bacterium]|jgi:signal transduction histidine kinase/ActR/RegA family two-component response regulator
MEQQAGVAQAGETPRTGETTYQMTLSGLVLPLRWHVAFDALGAACLLALGHPAVAAAALVGYCAVDIANGRLLARMIATSNRTDRRAGFRKLALLCAGRVSAYLAPLTFVALSGKPGELLVFGLQAVILIAMALSAGVLSRWVFWGLAGPVLAAACGLAVYLLAPLPAGAVLVTLAMLIALLTVMTETTRRVISDWRNAFLDKLALIPQLQQARDKALAERAAADQAREEARQAGRAKSNFLATMSHEIRTPMNGVLGMAQLLQRDEASPAQKARLAVLIDSGEYLLSILNDILDVSKIDAGRLDIMPAAEDVRLFLDRLVSFWAPRADEKGVELVLDLQGGVPDFALFDALRLRQVLFNLVGNALKFTERGRVSIVAQAAPNGEGAVLLHLAVHDTGMGISAEHLPQLFTRFTQGDESEARKFGGTGLGLAIAKQLVDLMGGRIWAESDLGEGSVFHIKLPLALAEGPALRKAPEAPEEAAPPAGLQVLAVDDNAVNLMVLDQLLSSFGHDIAKASSGAEALAALAEHAFDLVLLDIQMPGMSGVEVLQRLRAIDGPNRQVPVVALTADVTSGGRRRYLDLGFTEHSPKPIQIQELMDSIARAMAAGPEARQAVQAA